MYILRLCIRVSFVATINIEFASLARNIRILKIKYPLARGMILPLCGGTRHRPAEMQLWEVDWMSS
jgi:hypothetical protein